MPTKHHSEVYIVIGLGWCFASAVFFFLCLFCFLLYRSADPNHNFVAIEAVVIGLLTLTHFTVFNTQEVVPWCLWSLFHSQSRHSCCSHSLCEDCWNIRSQAVVTYISVGTRLIWVIMYIAVHNPSGDMVNQGPIKGSSIDFNKPQNMTIPWCLPCTIQRSTSLLDWADALPPLCSFLVFILLSVVSADPSHNW